jgi:hypothetical protein
MVAIGYCTLVSRTDRHASVEALEPSMNLLMCKATNIVLMNNICKGMKGNPSLDVEKDYSPVLPDQRYDRNKRHDAIFRRCHAG